MFRTNYDYISFKAAQWIRIRIYFSRLHLDPHWECRSGPRRAKMTESSCFEVLDVLFWRLRSVLRIRDVYPGCWFLPIPDPGSRTPDPKTATKERDEKKNFCQTFFCSHKFHKCKIIVFLNCSRKKFEPNFKEFRELFTQKVVTKLSKIWVWDPGSATLAEASPVAWQSFMSA